jgi:hypothetical protein
MMPPPINNTSVSCSWRVLVRVLLGPTACELVRPSFSSSDLSLTLLAFLFSAGETILGFKGNTEEKNLNIV